MSTETPTTSSPPPPKATAPPLSSPPGRQSWPGRWLWPRKLWLLAALLILAALSVPLWRAVNRPTQPAPAAAVNSAAQPVAVARVTREDLYNQVPIKAEFRPFQEVDLHAKVSGYVQDIKVDFGDHVKAGQLLATLDVPELKDELQRAVSAEQKAEADYNDAHLIYTRLLAVSKDYPTGVAQQELDTAAAKDRTTEAAIAEAKADVEKYRTMVAYTRITAPFDGIVTRRYVDAGALIQSGTASQTQSLPVVCISDNYRLRLDFPVSVDYVQDVHVGDQVQVRVVSLAGRTFTGTITRSSLKVDADTRTMIVELEVPNPKLELVPGMYAEVLFPTDRHPQALAIPVQAVPAGQTASVYLINSQNIIEERPVTLGLETPNRWEVTAGLKQGDLVLVGSRSEVKPGQKVEPKLLESLAQQ